mmetsp:Transcript_32114/g.46793  ORF Transcript_32114/g.46793 Transcript_32114/m.46793 type:complete len:89 (+) Transcript_32114:645-911(+)
MRKQKRSKKETKCLLARVINIFVRLIMDFIYRQQCCYPLKVMTSTNASNHSFLSSSPTTNLTSFVKPIKAVPNQNYLVLLHKTHKLHA